MIEQQMKSEGSGEKIENVVLSDLCDNKDLQVRVVLDEEVVADYVERMASGERFPPVVVYKDGLERYLVDGYHRVAAYKRRGKSTARCTYHEGTLSDAKWYAVGANKKNGLRMGREDVKRAVELASRCCAEKTQLQIAQQVGCAQQYVSTVQRDMVNQGDLSLPEKRVGADGKVRPTTYKLQEPEDAAEDDDAAETAEDAEAAKAAEAAETNEDAEAAKTDKAAEADEADEDDDDAEAAVPHVDPDHGDQPEQGSGTTVPDEAAPHEVEPGAAKAQGTRIARRVVALLESIDAHDPEREEAIRTVAAWIQNHAAHDTCEEIAVSGELA